MGLPRNVSIGTALGTAALVGGIHAQFTPEQASIRTSIPGTIGHADVNKSRRQATWLSAAAVSLIYLLTKDETTAIVGGLTVIGFEVITRYNNDLFPPTQRIETDDTRAEAMASQAATADNVVEMSPYADVM